MGEIIFKALEQSKAEVVDYWKDCYQEVSLEVRHRYSWDRQTEDDKNGGEKKESIKESMKRETERWRQKEHHCP